MALEISPLDELSHPRPSQRTDPSGFPVEDGEGTTQGAIDLVKADIESMV